MLSSTKEQAERFARLVFIENFYFFRKNKPTESRKVQNQKKL